VKYLLDVNALVALGLLQHEFHERTAVWVRAITRENDAELTTCSITELGFVRVLVQASQYGFNVAQARELLMQIKSAGVLRFSFVPDDHGVSQLPRWVKTAKQITDGHLAGLARSQGAVLATLDRKIPGAFLIP
jgi:predicted nucleic acid-binding protein